MGALATWYYRTDAGVVGPISSAELERLLDEGVVRSTTLIRRGESGSWFPSEGIIAELRPAITPSPFKGEGVADRPAAMPPLAATFQPPAPPRHPGTDSPVVPPPFAGIEIQAGPPPLLRPVVPRPSGFVSRLTRQPVLFGGIAAGIVVLGLISTAAWAWLRPGPDHVAETGPERPLARSVAPGREPSARPKTTAKSTPRPKGKTEQKNDVLASSPARKNQSRNDIVLPPKPSYPTEAPGGSPASVDRPKAGPRPKQQRKQAQPKNQPPPAPSRLEPITLETVLATPGKFTGQTITTDGLYKIGTLVKSVRGPDGKPVGWALPVARTDGSTICSGEAKALGHDAYLLLQDGLAPFVDGIFRKLRFQITLKPLHRCILTVAVRSQKVAGKDTSVVDITGLEILGACNILKVVEGRFDTAFTIVRITLGNADVAHGNGALWVALLGGEEKFVIPMRHRVKETMRHLAAQRDAALIDRYLRDEMSRVLMMSNAGQQQQTRLFEALLGRRITP